MTTRTFAKGDYILTIDIADDAAVGEPEPLTCTPGATAFEPTDAAARLEALLKFPLRAEPETEEERAIFAEAEEAIRAGQHGLTTEEFLAGLDGLLAGVRSGRVTPQ